MVIVKQAVLLALDHRISKPSQKIHSSDIFLDLLPNTVAGPHRHFTDFSIESLWTPIQYYVIVKCIF